MGALKQIKKVASFKEKLNIAKRIMTSKIFLCHAFVWGLC